MSAGLRGYTMRLHGAVDMVTEVCYKCDVLFAMTAAYKEERRKDHDLEFYCPNGHGQVYSGKTDTEKLRDAEIREQAVRDQLAAAIEDAEKVRQQTLRERQRIANGVCPCCNRSFENVRRHISSQHPEFPTVDKKTVRFECGCGLSFESFRGLRTHQGHARSDDWNRPNVPWWRSHLTEAASSR